MFSTNCSKPEAAPSEQRQGKVLSLLCCSGFPLGEDGSGKLWGLLVSCALRITPGMHRTVQQCLVHMSPPVTGMLAVRKHCLKPSVPPGNRWDWQPIGFGT